MTSPAAPQVNWQDAADQLSKLASGNQNLITHPNLVQALANSNATAVQAQTINQFLGGLNLRNQVQAARQAGTQLTLNDQDRSSLDALKVNYNDVDWTPQDEASAEAKAKQAQINDTNIQLASLQQQLGVNQPKGGGESWMSFGGFFHNVTHNPVTNEIGKLPGQVAAVGNWSRVAIEQATNSYSSDEKKAAKDQGYNLDNPWEAFAYEASGKRPINTNGLFDGYSDDEVQAAFNFADDPNTVLNTIVNNTDANARKSQLEQISDKKFQDLVTKIRANTPTPGNVVTYGIDPVAHPVLHNILSTSTDVIYSFLSDPTMAAFNARGAYKLSKIGLDGIGDQAKVLSVLDGTTKGIDAARIRNGRDQLLASSKLIVKAAADGDDGTVAAETARLRAIGLDHLLPDFAGHRAIGYDVTNADRPFLFEHGAPIESADDANTYLSSRVGLMRMMTGQPTMEGRLIPGALSSYGYKMLKSTKAANTARKSLGASQHAVEVNKSIAASRVGATLDDAVDSETGDVLASPSKTILASDETGVAASSIRGAAYRQSRVGKVALSSPSGATQVGLSVPSVANRIRLAVNRTRSYLPNSVEFSITDPTGAKRVFQYGNMYLSRGDANLLQGLYSVGDEGVRKAVLQSMHLQTLHAAGLGSTEGGRDVIAGASRALTDQHYTSVPGLDRVLDPTTGEDQAWAVHLSQMNPSITLTDFRTLQDMGAKIGFWQASLGRVLNSSIVDSVMPLIRLGWQATGTNIMRNAGESVVMAAARGEYGDMIRAKAALTLTGAARKRTIFTRPIADFAPVARVGQLYQHALIDTAKPETGMSHILDLIEEDPEMLATVQTNWSKLHLAGFMDPKNITDASAIMRDGYVPVKATMRYKGFTNQALGEDMASAERYASTLGIVHGGDSQYADAMLAHLIGGDKPYDTRGLGVQYHGTTKPIKDLSEGYYNNKNIYGAADTFYTTDAADVAAGYGRKSANAHVYQVSEKSPVDFYDMESETSPLTIEQLLGVAGEHGDFDAFARQAIEDSVEKTGKATLRGAMDQIRRASREEGYSRDEVQELFDHVTDKLKNLGYGGMRHTGGDFTGAASHEVKIYLKPHEQLTLAPHVPAAAPTTIDDLVKLMQAPARAGKLKMARFANMYQDANGITRNAVTDADKDLAVTQLAHKQVQDWRYLLSDRDGSLNEAMVGHMRETGQAPTAQWLMDNLPKAEDRPMSVSAAAYEPMPTTGPGKESLAGALADLGGKGYNRFAENPINRMSADPILLANYGKQRYILEGAKSDIMASGISEQATNGFLRQIAMQKAFDLTTTYVDHPALRTQMDIVGRNFFAYSRATRAFAQRWVTNSLENPARLRKVFLALEGAHHTGFTYTDANGNEQYIFPGSGAALNAITKFASLVPGLNMVQVPGATPDLTGRVALLQPGVQNPLQLSLTPMINIPYRAISKLFPQDRATLDAIDGYVNGSQGQGAGLLSEIEPTAAKKFTDALNSSDTDSQTASVVRASILNLEAAGMIPDNIESDPSAKQQLLSRLRVQAKNQLFARTFLGFFSPGPPGLPSEETAGSKPDWFYASLGARGLNDEYKRILNDANGNYAQANLVWTQLHPDKLFYETGSSVSTTKNAVFSATDAAQGWIQNNTAFMDRYKTVAAYFIPLDTQDGTFSLAAYHAEFEDGLRQHKTSEQYLDDVVTANAANQYYAATKSRDASIQANPDLRTSIEKQFTAWKSDFNAVNPLWAAQSSDVAVNIQTARQNLGSLRSMATATKLPGSVPQGALTAMIHAFDTYHSVMDANPGSSADADHTHAEIGSQYNTYMAQLVDANPQLAGLYQGVFRTLDSSVLDPLNPSGS